MVSSGLRKRRCVERSDTHHVELGRPRMAARPETGGNSPSLIPPKRSNRPSTAQGVASAREPGEGGNAAVGRPATAM